MNLFNELYCISEMIPADFGGGSSLSKTYLMAYLILRNNLKTYVEIGVYKGKSLFPATFAIKQHNGISYGIDPYNKDAAREFDIEEKILENEINQFIDELDFEKVYQDVNTLRSKLDFQEHLELIRKKSSESVGFFRENDIDIDMLHIDGNHDTKYVMADVELFLPLLNPNSIVVMDDIDWNSVKPAYEKLKETTTVIFESKTFAIIINNKIPEELVKKYEFELKCTYNLIEGLTENFLLIKKNSPANDLEAIIAEKVNVINNLESSNFLKDKKIKELESTINQ